MKKDRDQDSDSEDGETSKNEPKETATYAPTLNDMMGHHSSYIPSQSSHNYTSQIHQPYYFQSYSPHQQYPYNNNIGNGNLNNMNGRYYSMSSHHS